MKRILGLVLLMLAVLSFTPISYDQVKASDQLFTSDGDSQIRWVAANPYPSLSPLGVAPALMFPSCESPSGLVLLMVATYEPDSYVMSRKPTAFAPSADMNNPREARPQKLVVYPLSKEGPARQPCTIQDAKSGIYEPVPGSLLSAFPIA